MSSYTHLSIPSNYDVEDAFSSTSAPNYTPTSPDYSQHFFLPEDISPPKDTETPIESPILVSPSLSVRSSSPVRSTTPPPDYPFDESIFAELDNSLWIIPRPLGSEPVPEEPDESDTCESAKSTSLYAIATGTGETTLVGGLKYSSNISWNKRSQSFLIGGYIGFVSKTSCLVRVLNAVAGVIN
ncbi:hypothetical protein Tco_0845837 [Tanacetum coccineum]